jgi:hypothetical protein
MYGDQKAIKGKDMLIRKCQNEKNADQKAIKSKGMVIRKQ